MENVYYASTKKFGFGLGMKKSFCVLILLWAQSIFSQTAVEGEWHGVLNLGLTDVYRVFHIKVTESGTLSAKIDTPELELFGTRLNAITFENEMLNLQWGQRSMSYTGALTPEGDEIVGTLTQKGFDFPLTLKREKPHRLPLEAEPLPLPCPYLEEEVKIVNRWDGVILSGTFTSPSSKQPFQTVILIGSSGPNDRDESFLHHKPFLVLADHLTRKGIAVLRFDKRGVEQSTGSYEDSTIVDFAKDVLSAIDYLKTQKNITRVALIGYSEGGTVASIVSMHSRDIDFIVLMAAPGVNGEELAYKQTELISKASGVSEEQINGDLKLQKELVGILKQVENPPEATPLLHGAIKEYLASFSDKEKRSLSPKSGIEINLWNYKNVCTLLNTHRFRFFLTYEPSILLKHITIPVLAINGELDLQVAPSQNLPVIEKALREAGNTNYQILELPKLNHLFQVCKTGAMTEYKENEETISPTALNVISDWIFSVLDKK